MTRNAHVLLFSLLALSCDAFLAPTPTSSHHKVLASQVSGEDTVSSRREALGFVFFGALVLSPMATNALDMDAFVNSQIESDTKNCNPKTDSKCIPKLSADEALCKYGQSGEKRGEACKRFKSQGGALPTSQPKAKSLGGAYAM